MSSSSSSLSNLESFSVICKSRASLSFTSVVEDAVLCPAAISSDFGVMLPTQLTHLKVFLSFGAYFRGIDAQDV